MLLVYRDTGTFLTSSSTEVPGEIIWIDVFNPTEQEKDFVQSRTGGIYGMNFKFMPELNWPLGYPFGLAMVVLSVLIPLAWFKWRGWF